MSERDAESLKWSWNYVARGLAGLLALLGWAGYAPSHMLRGAWRAANREMRYLEGMVRRLVVAQAGALCPIAPLPARDPARKVPRQRAPRPPAPRGFSLFEHEGEPDFRGWFDGQEAPAAKGPWPVSGEVHPVVPAHALAARISALQSMLEAPGKAARRMARRLARRASVICLTRRPLARGGPYDLKRDAFFEAERLALAFLNRAFLPTGPPG